MRKNLKEKQNHLLLCIDESKELPAAIDYACNNAEENNYGLILLYVIEEENFRHSHTSVYNVRKYENPHRYIYSVLYIYIYICIQYIPNLSHTHTPGNQKSLLRLSLCPL